MKVSDLPSTIQGSRVEYNVIVNVRPVCMGSHNKSIFTLGESFGQLMTNGICFSRFEGLANLIGNHVSTL